LSPETKSWRTYCTPRWWCQYQQLGSDDEGYAGTDERRSTTGATQKLKN
jgi:hypothetical protein